MSLGAWFSIQQWAPELLTEIRQEPLLTAAIILLG